MLDNLVFIKIFENHKKVKTTCQETNQKREGWEPLGSLGSSPRQDAGLPEGPHAAGVTQGAPRCPNRPPLSFGWFSGRLF